jgi:hypothetical protein
MNIVGTNEDWFGKNIIADEKCECRNYFIILYSNMFIQIKSL